uniref:C-type lectin domain-containing protein n=1 Tax=Sparus aurata TaxID=8175 RepID=A0A671XBP2_SPAAU
VECFVALDSSLCCNLFKAEPCGKCQEGWEQNGPQCYYFSTDKLTWEQARDECQQNGAHLSFLIQTLRDKMTEKEDKFWIGLTDSVTEGTCAPVTLSLDPRVWWFDKSCTQPHKCICEKSAEIDA